jgi:hypothetical protein
VWNNESQQTDFAFGDVIDTSASPLLTPNENDFKLFVFQFELYRQGYKTNLSFETNTYISLLPSITPKTPPNPSSVYRL